MKTFRIAWCGAPLAGGRTSLLALGATAAQLGVGECVLTFQLRGYRVPIRATRLEFGGARFFPTLEEGLRTAEGDVFRRLEFELAFLRNVDGIVFVVDAQRERWGANLAALERLRRELRSASREPDEVPLVFQLNKCDLTAQPVFDASLTWTGAWFFQTVATRGEGVRFPLDALLTRLIGSVSAEQWKANELLQRPLPPSTEMAINEFVAASSLLNARGQLPPAELFERILGRSEDILNSFLALTPDSVVDAEPRLREWGQELRQHAAEWTETNSRAAAGRGKNET